MLKGAPLGVQQLSAPSSTATKPAARLAVKNSDTPGAEDNGEGPVENVLLLPSDSDEPLVLPEGTPAYGHNSRAGSARRNRVRLSPDGIFVGAPARYWKNRATIYINIDGLKFIRKIRRGKDGLYLRLDCTRAALLRRLDGGDGDGPAETTLGDNMESDS